jgi:hypothetical protein
MRVNSGARLSYCKRTCKLRAAFSGLAPHAGFRCSGTCVIERCSSLPPASTRTHKDPTKYSLYLIATFGQFNSDISSKKKKEKLQLLLFPFSQSLKLFSSRMATLHSLGKGLPLVDFNQKSLAGT